MAREIKESDWKLFRSLHGIALERFCQRVIEEVGSAMSSCADGYHDCYLKLFALMRSRDKEMARAFNDPRRANAFILLANIKELGLLSEEEFMQFSPEARDAVEVIVNIRRAQQSLAADGAIACFSSNLFPFSLNADRAPQLKASVMPLRCANTCLITAKGGGCCGP